MHSFPSAFGRLLSNLALHLTPPTEVVVLGGPDNAVVRDLLRSAHRGFLPGRLVAGGDPATLPSLPLFRGRTAKDGGPTAYVCRNFTCTAPITDAGELEGELWGGGVG
jgi:uncharacterized protein YyaL (SSP411 family)